MFSKLVDTLSLAKIIVKKRKSLLEGHTPSFPSTGSVIFIFDISTCCILILAGVTASRKVYIPIPHADRKTQFKVNQMVGNKIAQKARMPKL